MPLNSFKHIMTIFLAIQKPKFEFNHLTLHQPSHIKKMKKEKEKEKKSRKYYNMTQEVLPSAKALDLPKPR